MTEQPMTHPMTDKIIEQILDLPIKNLSAGERYFAIHAARGSADWQLEQVLHWLRTTQWYLNPSTLADLLEEAMRPQQQQDELVKKEEEQELKRQKRKELLSRLTDEEKELLGVK